PWSKRVTSKVERLMRFEGDQILPGDQLPPADAGGLLLNAMNIAPEHEGEFNEWYDKEHIPALAAVPGVLCARRFRGTGNRKYVALYHLATPEVQDSAEGADVLTMTDLRGVETHGVSNMLRAYVRDYKAGKLDPRPGWRMTRESPGTAVIDAERRLGIMVGPKAMRLAIEKARRVGVGVVTVFNSGHFGAIGHYAVQAAEQGMVGVCFTGAGLSVVPTFAAKPLLGTNPIALAAPARHEAPMLFDAATSAIAGNKIRLAIRVGSPLLPGWVTDKEGIPIMEEKPVFDRDEYHQAPLGGTREQGSHKGYGFALMAEVLSTVLSGALPTMLSAGSGSKNHFAAYNIEAFTDPEQFKDTMDGML